MIAPGRSLSCAAALLTGKTALIILSVHRLSFLRHTASLLILIGAGCAVVNLGVMVGSLLRQQRERQRADRAQRAAERDGVA